MRRLVLFITLSCSSLLAETPVRWTLAQDNHFKIYSQTADDTAQQTLAWFEQLRQFFEQSDLLATALSLQDRPPVQIVGFRSEKEYEEFRLRPIADAYYASGEGGDYIVMANLKATDFSGIAAHEYAHYVLHSRGLKLPACFNEGLAEFFSTLRPVKGGYEIGGDLPARRQVLQRNKWLPLSELLDSPVPAEMQGVRKRADIFYSESWALVDMLATAPRFAPHFRELLAECHAGSNAAQAFRKVYAVSLDDVAQSLENWVQQVRSPRLVLITPAELTPSQNSTLSSVQAGALLAHLSLVNGHLAQARMRYEELLKEDPGNADFSAALGNIALRQGNRGEALTQWRRALDGKVTDAELCYRFALLADESGLEEQSVRAALERAVALAPAFDDARYKLALIESSAGDYRSALAQLRAMRIPTGPRSYAYWIAVTSALTELDLRDEAKQAALSAENAAQTEAEKAEARRLAYVAATDLTVQFATDSEGRSQMVTTRIPHGTTEWNPFIEPSDRIQRSAGRLGEVVCAAGKLSGFVVLTATGPVRVEVPDPLHVLMRNSPPEFFCGPAQGKSVEAQYAVSQTAGKTRNVLRGMTFLDGHAN